MALTPIQQRLAEIRAGKTQATQPAVSGSPITNVPKVDIKTRLAQIRMQNQPKTVAQQRQERIAQGLPVSVNKSKVDPTLAGNIVRGVIKAPLSVALSIPAAVRGEKGIAVNSKYLGRTTDIAKGINEKSDALAARVNKGEISLGRAIAGAVGNAALATADVASVAPVGGFLESAGVNTAKAVAGQTAKQTAKQLAIGAGKSFARGAGTGALYDIGAQVGSGDKYNLGQTLKSAAIGGALDVGLSQVAPRVIGGVANKGKQIYTNNFTQAGRESAAINRVTEELKKVENNYEKLRKNQKFSKDANAGSRSRVVSSGVLNNVTDETGTISKIDDAIKKYREISPLNKTEGVVRKNLERLGETIDPSVVEKELVQAVYASGLEGADLRNALNTVKKEVAGYRLRADKSTGKIPLTLVHDAKISTTNGINFQTPPEIKTYRKAIASGLKKTVENNSSFNTKQVNESLAPYLQDIEYLTSLAGRKVQGGKLGKYTAQIAGNITGATIGGAVGGLPGSAIGTIVGGEVGSAIKGRSLSRTLGGVVGKDLPESKILQKAVETGNSPRLGLPAPSTEFRSVVGSGPVINLPGKIEPIYKSPRIALQPQKTIIPIKKPAKIGIPKASTKSAIKSKDLSTDLVNEAKKYKSAEEFVNKINTIDLPKKSYKNAEEILKDAPAAKKEIDTIADTIAAKFKGTSVAKAPLKKPDRIFEKVMNESNGNFNDIKDVARNTIISDEAGKNIQGIHNELKKFGKNDPNFKIKLQKADDYMGYSGSIINLKTKSGLVSEIQVNTPKMIYAKESTKDAKAILGEALYNKMQKTYGEGGLGHKYYEDFRSLTKSEKEGTIGQNIINKSKTYYSKFNQ